MLRPLNIACLIFSQQYSFERDWVRRLPVSTKSSLVIAHVFNNSFFQEHNFLQKHLVYLTRLLERTVLVYGKGKLYEDWWRNCAKYIQNPLFFKKLPLRRLSGFERHLWNAEIFSFVVKNFKTESCFTCKVCIQKVVILDLDGNICILEILSHPGHQNAHDNVREVCSVKPEEAPHLPLYNLGGLWFSSLYNINRRKCFV